MARRRAKVVRSVEAYDDVADIATYIARDSLRASDRFVAAVDRTIEGLAAMPLTGSPYPLRNPALANLRMMPVRGFHRYLVFYRYTDNEVQILRVFHGARDIPTLLGETRQHQDNTE